MPDAILELDGLEVAYDGVPAVRDLSLAVARGEIVGLIGPNGAGKSTTLHAVMGLVRAAGGDIRYSGRSIQGRAPEKIARAGVALVPEGRRIYPHLTVDDNLKLGFAAARRRGSRAKALAEVRELFPVLGRYRKRLGGGLSGGEQQQLAIGRALAGRPRVLLLDEPTEGIQPSVIWEIERAVDALRQRGGLSILLVEQFVEFAVGLSDIYYMMEKGTIVAQGSSSELTEETVREYLAV
jgi:urea ABC transporter ATP-binding protein UrtE